MPIRETTGAQGMMFGMDGPAMSGTWVNPKTGNTFTVRDSFLQDGQLMVQTTDGRMLDYNTIQNYVQSTDSQGNHVSYPSNSIMQSPDSAKKKTANIPSEILGMIESPSQNTSQNTQINTGEEFLTDDDKEILDSLDIAQEPLTSNNAEYHHHKLQTSLSDTEFQWCEKALGDKPLPDFNIEGMWEDVPAKSISTIIDVLGVLPETVIKYYTEKCISLINQEEITEKIRQVVSDTINNIVEMGAPEFMNSYVSSKVSEKEPVGEPIKDDVKEPVKKLVKENVKRTIKRAVKKPQRRTKKTVTK